MTELLTRIETHVAVGLDASPGFFLSESDLKEIARALRVAAEIERLRARNAEHEERYTALEAKAAYHKEDAERLRAALNGE